MYVCAICKCNILCYVWYVIYVCVLCMYVCMYALLCKVDHACYVRSYDFLYVRGVLCKYVIYVFKSMYVGCACMACKYDVSACMYV